jgi:hypothetical protein
MFGGRTGTWGTGILATLAGCAPGSLTGVDAGGRSDNAAPVVVTAASASPASLTLPQDTATLSIVAIDPDEGPTPLQYTWSKVSGPAPVLFSPNAGADAATVSATFAAAGIYDLQVLVSDGEAWVSSTLVGLAVLDAAANVPPVIRWGPELSSWEVSLPGRDVTVSVGGYDPDAAPAPLTYVWSVVSGPGSGLFAPNGTDDAAESTVTLDPVVGTYLLRVTVSDGAAAVSADVAVTLLAAATRPDDAHEEDDTPAQANEAAPLAPLQWVAGVQGDDDYYRIDVSPVALNVRIVCEFTNALGDIDLAFCDADGQELAVSIGVADSEHIAYTVAVAGAYYVRVHYEDAGNPYRLVWWALADTDDPHEDDDDPAAADIHGALLPGVPQSGVQGDDDYYPIVVASGYPRVRATCTSNAGLGDIDLELRSEAGVILAATLGMEDVETLESPPLAQATYYLRVSGADRGNLYDLVWNTISSDDTHEEDDSRAAADLAVSPPADVWVAGVQWDDDYYRIEPDPALGPLEVDCDFFTDLGDIDIELQNAAGVMITSSSGVDNREHVSIPISDAGPYYIRIFYSNAGNSYRLRWRQIPPQGLDDAHEEDDTIGEAAMQALLPAATAFAGIQRDDDFFRIPVAAGALRVRVSCTFVDADGDIDLELYDPYGALVASAAGDRDLETLDVVVAAAETFYLRVHGANQGNAYELQWEGLLAVVDDPHEPDDSIAAGEMRSGLTAGVWVDGIQRNDDFFRIQVQTDRQHLAVDCRFTHLDGNIDLEVQDATGTALGTAAGTGDSETIDLVVPTAGTYYLRVMGANAGNSYRLRWDATSSVVDDAHEEDDTRLLADGHGNLPDGVWFDGIQRDHDYFRIQLTGSTLHIQVECTFTHADGDIDLDIQNATGATVALSFGEVDNELIDFRAAGPGTYYLIVYYGNRGNPYRLRWTIVP